MTYDMIQSTAYAYGEFLESCDEDVVVLGHSDHKDIRRDEGLHGKSIIYANNGCLHDEMTEVIAKAQNGAKLSYYDGRE